MLSSLTSYLTQFKKVVIPSIGTFELKYQPATLDFANRLIRPPVQEVYFQPVGTVPAEQANYLGSELGLDVAGTEEQLHHFGRSLKAKVAVDPFLWEGFGELSSVNDSVVFAASRSSSLNEVRADKIIRQNVHHGVLVGEKEMSSGDTSYIEVPTKSKRSLVQLIGWIVVLMAAVFITYQLNRGNFHPFAAGLQQKSVPNTPIEHFR